MQDPLNLEHRVIRCDLSDLGSGDLVGKAANVAAPASEWWPYRNQMLVTLAAMECIKDWNFGPRDRVPAHRWFPRRRTGGVYRGLKRIALGPGRGS